MIHSPPRYRSARRVLLLAGVLLVAVSPAWGQVTASGSGSTPLYETFELTLTAPGVAGNKFRVFASVTFSKDGRSFAADGFHDGGDLWRARFMPDREGTWTYSWSFQGSSGSGSFSCTARSNARNHGHVKRDPARPRYLLHDDGTAHHWYGGKWIAGSDYGPASKGAETNPDRISDAQFLSYFDTCAQYRHNGLLLKTALYPLENDKFSWDLGWVRRGEWLVREMRARGIYCQLNFFDTWSRDRNSWFNYNTSGSSQVFNVWASGDEAAKENYIRTLVARFGGYANVYWELGNEMEHSPNSGSSFVTQANANYIPWIRKYDPYGLPIGLSEEIWQSANVDIGFLHQTGSLPSTSATRPNLMNELVSGCSTGSLWQDSTIRNSAARLCYRRTFWRMFTYGGAGSSEATWLDIRTALNSAALNVMDDQKRLRDFLEALPVHLNDMVTDTAFVNSGPGSFRTRRKAGEAYVTYFLGSSGAGTVSVNLPSGTYEAGWYYPATAQATSPVTVTSTGGAVSLSHPSFSEDLVLRIVRSSGGTPPPGPVGITGTSPASYAWDILDVGKLQYIDRSFTFSGVPASYVGLQYLKTANDDKLSSGSSFVSFTVDRDVTVYVAHDDRLSPKPSWMSGWADTGAELVSGAGTFSLFAKDFPAGAVTLGGNGAATTASSMYSVVVRPRSTGGTGLTVTVDFVSTGKPYSLSTAQAGALYYIDRSYTISSLSSTLAGASLIRTANDDKYATASTHLKFSVNQSATVYVAYDKRATSNPAWLNDGTWTQTSLSFAVSDGSASPMRVFSKAVGAGQIALGGNHAGGATGALSNYVVLIRGSGSAAKLPEDAWEHPGDADGDGLEDAFEAAGGLDPGNPDTDGDGEPDESELAPSGRTWWDEQQGAGSAGGDSGGRCGLLGAEALLLLALLTARGRSGPGRSRGCSLPRPRPGAR